jgi:hypothetical protein
MLVMGARVFDVVPTVCDDPTIGQRSVAMSATEDESAPLLTVNDGKLVNITQQNQ